MHARLTLAIGAIGASLAFAGPALAASTAPLPGLPHPPVAPHHATARVLAATTTGAGPTLYVNGTTGSDSGSCMIRQPCQTIQYAINQAPPTAKIDVAAGNYPEQLTITGKNLVITGAGRTKTTIDPTALPQTDGERQTPVVEFQNGTADGLSDLTVDGTGVPGSVSCETGVELFSASARLFSDNVMVSSLANASFSCGAGVYAFDGTESSAYTLTMSASSVSDYGNTGVSCFYESCDVSGTHVVGYGPTGAGEQSGIYVEYSPGATLTGDTVTGNSATSPGFTGSNYSYLEDDIGLAMYNVGTALVSKNISTGNDVGFYGGSSTGSWTITQNTFSHATNYTGSAPGSVPVPAGFVIGDGLFLDGVDGANVDGNTISSNSGRGMTLTDTVDSTFSAAANGRANTVSHNVDDGIALTDVSFPGYYAYTGTSSGNTFSGNTIDANGGDGIFGSGNDSAGPEQEDNTLSGNAMLGNFRWDALDQSTSSGSDGTANQWTSNACKTSSPAGICTAGAS